MPEVHAILSASSSKRWLNCTPSARLEQNFPNESSVYAEEGAAAHALGEYKLRKYLHERVRRPTSEFDTDEMDANTDIYAEYIISTVERIKETCPHPLVMVEERLDYSYLVPQGFGTGDCVIIADGMLSDPPYNVDVEETAGKIMNDNMGDSEFYEFLLASFKQMHGHLADDGSIYIFHADTEGLNFRKAFKDAGFYLSGCCIWKKNALVLGRSPYQWQHEPCLYGWKLKGKHQWYSDRKQTTIWEYDRPKANKDHPTMKPIGLMSYPIRNSTMTNGIVLDPFLGSGSTLIACEETDRVCRGIELDPKFVDVIVKRYIEHSADRYEDVYVLRSGQKLKFDEVASFQPEQEDADD